MRKIYLLSLFLIIFGFSFGQKDFTAPHIVKNGTVITKGQAADNIRSGIYESFELAVPPTAWAKANPDGGSGWAQVADGTSPLPGWQGGTMTVPANGGNNAAYCTWNTGGSTSNDQWLITPAITIETGNELKFWMYHYSSQFKDNLEILLSTTDANTTSFTTNIHTFTDLQDSPWTEYTYDLSTYVGQTVYFAFRDVVADNQANGGFLAIDLVQIGTREPVDIVLQELTTPNYSQQGNVSITGDIINIGANAINSFDVTYNINGGTESAVYHATGLDIASDASYSFTHDLPNNFDTDGNYTINVTISNVNGGGEINLGDNTKSKDIIIYTTAIQRISLLEQFSTENCPNCPPVLTALETHLSENPNFIILTHHTGYGTDPFTINESVEQLEFYGGGPYAPAGMVDRHYNGLDNDANSGVDPGPVFWDRAPYGANRIDERTAVPAFTSVNINGTNDAGTLNLTVSGNFLTGFNKTLGVSLWITEDGITTTGQAGASGTWTHRFTVRDAISARLGDEITTSTNSGDSYSKTYTFTLDGAWDVDNLYLVAMVSNMSDNINEREIHNAKQVKLSDLQAVSVSDITSNVIKIYPNPANDILNIYNAEGANVEIIDIVGKVIIFKNNITAQQAINVLDLNNGTYFIKISKNNTIETQKIVISK